MGISENRLNSLRSTRCPSGKRFTEVRDGPKNLRLLPVLAVEHNTTAAIVKALPTLSVSVQPAQGRPPPRRIGRIIELFLGMIERRLLE